MGKFSSKKSYESMTIYEQVYTIMEDLPYTRNSDKELIWEVWVRQNIVEIEYPRRESINKNNFINLAANFETIRRSRQSIQEEHKKKVADGEMKVADSLLAKAQVAEFRAAKEEEKGTHIFREKAPTLFNPAEEWQNN